METAVQEMRADQKFSVTVLFNGVPRSFEVEPNEAVQALLSRALQAFGITAQQHTYALFPVGSTTELPTHLSLKAAGVNPGEQLILRPRAVAGG